MQPAFPFRLRGQQLWLSPHRCLFWEEERSLILSDLHFGKTGHFRKAGIAVPQSVYREDLLRLLSLIQYFQPRQLLVVGDLFHSRENKELQLFRRWRDDFPELGIELVLGNHDILHAGWYVEAGIRVTRDALRVGPFAFIHDIEDMGGGDEPEGADEMGMTDAMCGVSEIGEGGQGQPYYFSGHLHPGIRIRGMGRQHLQFPCFYFGGEYAILPAFGRFTGTVSVDPAPEANVFAILPPTGRERGGIVYQRGRAGVASPGRGLLSPERGGWVGGAYGAGSIFQVQ